MPDPHEDESDDAYPDAAFETWRVHDAGGPVLCLKVRYRDDMEIPGWRDGPDLFTALQLAEAQGWQAFDREPGHRPGEYAIVHMKRDRRTDDPSR